MIGKWSGTPLRTFLERIGADTTARYVGFECADGYYEGIDMPTALHPQTLMAFRLSDEILPTRYGHPFKTASRPSWVFIRAPSSSQRSMSRTSSRAAIGRIAATTGSAASMDGSPRDLCDGCHGEGAAARASEDPLVSAAGTGAGRGNSVPRFCATLPRTSPLHLARCRIDGHIAYAPGGNEGWFAGHLAEGTALVLADGSPPMPHDVQGFGRCLLHAAQALFATGFGAVCLVNSDSPTLPTAVVDEAARALLAPGERIVLGPAEDGGYYLLGMQRPHAHLFAGIAWSTSTCRRDARAGRDTWPRRGDTADVVRRG